MFSTDEKIYTDSKQWLFAAFVPNPSSGPVPDFHMVPYAPQLAIADAKNKAPKRAMAKPAMA